MGSQVTPTMASSPKRATAPVPESVVERRAASYRGQSAPPEVIGASPGITQIQVLPPGASFRPQASLPNPPILCLQRKLAIGSVNNPFEHEADRVAEQVMRMSVPAAAAAGPTAALAVSGVQRRCSFLGSCDNCQVKQGHEHGQPLNSVTRAFMEPRFGHDFGGVRVHAGPAAERSAQEVNADAYTVGHQIVFGAGQPASGTHEGWRLLAHELTHVVQQDGGTTLVQRDAAKENRSRDKAFARQRGQAMVEKIKQERKLSKEARAKINQELAYFIDSAKDAYLKEIEPALKRLNKAEISGEQQEATPVLAELASEVKSTFLPVVQGGIDLLMGRNASEAIQDARAAFRARHNDHDKKVLDNIDAALERVTKNNPDLLIAYYNFYSDHKLTDDLDVSDENLGNTDMTFRRGIFTELNRGLLLLEHLPQAPTDDPLLLLGTTLIHEFSHTPQGGNPLKGPTEGKAYGIENFFAERVGDKLRDEATLKLGGKMGHETAVHTSYTVMKKLYEVIDTGASKSPNLKGVSAKRAREMTVEFISKNQEDFSDDLRKFISTEFQAPYGSSSLP